MNILYVKTRRGGDGESALLSSGESSPILNPSLQTLKIIAVCFQIHVILLPLGKRVRVCSWTSPLKRSNFDVGRSIPQMEVKNNSTHTPTAILFILVLT